MKTNTYHNDCVRRDYIIIYKNNMEINSHYQDDKLVTNIT